MVANDTLTFHDVVMGDVFLSAGQSNMGFKTKNVTQDQLFDALSDADYPDLRFFDIAKVVRGGQLTGDTDKPWESATPERIPDWSAIAFFFGRDLHKDINIPVGIINCSQGGASTEAFISPESFFSDSLLNAAKRSDETDIYQYYRSPSSLYNSMVSKIVGFQIKGVIWYQGETNAQYWQSFKTVFKGLINDWRTRWNEPKLPWLYVQLPAYDAPKDHTNMNWAETRNIQLQCWKEDPTIGMVVGMDCGEPNDVHPPDKYTIVKRLLPYAKALIYDEQVIHKSPIYKSHEILGSDVFVSFENTGGGLMAKKEITEFEIAGEDKVYKYAKAVLLPDNRIKLSEPTVSVPVYVRYAFRNYSSISIYTSDAMPLPLSPFKTETPKRFSILGLGDSVTRGAKTYQSYLFPLWDKLFAAGYSFDFVGPNESTYRNKKLSNSGFGGKTAEYLASHIDSIYQKYPADIVLLHASHNHFDTENPIAGIIKAQQSIIHKILKINPEAKILVAKVITSGKLPKYSYIPALNEATERMVEQVDNENIFLVDQAEGFDWEKYTIADKVHPNPAGAERMAEVWFDTLKKILE